MAYGQGNLITAADFNSIVADVNEVYADSHSGNTTEATANYGYGKTAVPTVSAGNLITAAGVNSLLTAIHECATHQGTSVGSVPASVSAGTLITAYDGVGGLLDVVSNIRTNRLNVAAGQTTTTSGGTKLISSRATAWTNTIVHEFTVTFSTYNAARYYFNTGGQIRLSADRTGGTVNDQNTSWDAILSNMGTIIFGHTETTTTGVTGTASTIGFYNLTSTFQTVFTVTGSGDPLYSAYSSDSYTVEARADGGLGSSGVIRFRVTFTDAGDNLVDSSADGTIRSLIDERRSTGSVTITSPTYATVTGLAAGS